MFPLRTHGSTPLKVADNPPSYHPRMEGKIHLVQQFFISPSKERQREILACLHNNIALAEIDRIHLLNEREYTLSELGITSDMYGKVTQVVVGKRLTYELFFNYASTLSGYVALSNSDIFFNHTLTNVFHSSLYYRKSCFAQLRIEPNGVLYGGGAWSQDSWIFHSRWIPRSANGSGFPLGKAGCDNRIAHILSQAGFLVYNEPWRIMTFHLHASAVRTYSTADRVRGPYLLIKPNPDMNPNRPQRETRVVTEEAMRETGMFWQYPVITEKSVFRQEMGNCKFFGFPWATVIDRLLSAGSSDQLERKRFSTHMDSISNCLRGSVTCCQHIEFRKILYMLGRWGIRTLYTPHKRIGEDSINEVRIKSCPLYAVNFEDPARNKEFHGIDFRSVPRDLLFSFIGAWQQNYLSLIRKHIFALPSAQDVVIVNTGTWHFNVDVYSNTQTGAGKLSRVPEQDEKTKFYNDTLLRSRFSLCPSGTGPSSIRLWESLACGSVPVILADTLDLPYHPLWADSVIRIPESRVANVRAILSAVPKERETVMRSNCLKIYDDFRSSFLDPSFEEVPVPKVLFTSYLCDEKEPVVQRTLGAWRELNPEFEVKYFSGSDVGEFFKGKSYEQTYRELKNGVAVADFFRVCYIQEHGGYWFDLDLPAVRIPLPPAGSAHFFDCGSGNISYMLIGGTRSKIFETVIGSVVRNVREAAGNTGPIEITGPRVVQALIGQQLGRDLKDGTFAAHQWWDSYLSGSSYEFKYIRLNVPSVETKQYKTLQQKYKRKHHSEYKYL